MDTVEKINALIDALRCTKKRVSESTGPGYILETTVWTDKEIEEIKKELIKQLNYD